MGFQTFTTIFTALLASTVVLATPIPDPAPAPAPATDPLSALAAREAALVWIDHDQVAAFADSFGTGVSANLYSKFKPWLKVQDGCVPFPAVDRDGRLGSGLKNSGAMNGRCSSSPGQVYVRGGTHNGLFAIMYAWYFPKDMNVDGPGNFGHRHDWENIVVFLSEQGPNARIKGISYSSHSGYIQRAGSYDLDGSRPKVKYHREGGIKNHSVDSTGTKGGAQAMINWAQLPAKARDALNRADYGSANCPFKDSNFSSKLKSAFADKYKQ
jgi:hypothetical protein